MAANSPSPMGFSQLELIEEMTRNAKEVQQELLAQILAQNAETEYLKGFGLNGDIDTTTFKAMVPMVTYEDIQPLIRRIADGDHSPILCAQPISQLFISSGTSGEPKLIPSTKEALDRTLLLCHLSTAVINKHVKGLDKGKGLRFMFIRPDMKTRGGTLVQTVTTSIYKSINTSARPNEAIYCADAFESMYVQMLCVLYEREQVLWVEMVFASGLVRVIKFLQDNWRQLTHDIRTGSLNPKVTDPSTREFMARFMRPDPDLADRIGNECAEDNWEGIITRIWPNTKFLRAIITGTMVQYIPSLEYYSGGLPILSMIYASSESSFGINLDPMCKPSDVSYTYMPFLAYFEFLPFEPDSVELTHSDLVDLVDVKIGEEYEMVIRTIAGLYRYRMGDIVRVAGFYNSAPQFQFVTRKNVLLNVDWEKTKETELQAAVENASQLLRRFDTSLADYTSYVDTGTVPGHYVIYWGLHANDSANWPSNEVLDQCCLVMEESLNSIYRLLRVSDKTIGSLEIRVVNNGTFKELMDNAISRGVSISQYKAPRCVRSKPMVDILESRVVSKHFSPSLPHWSPEKRTER